MRAIKQDRAVWFPCVMENAAATGTSLQVVSHVTRFRITAEQPVSDEGWTLGYLNDGFKVWFRFVGKSIR